MPTLLKIHTIMTFDNTADALAFVDNELSPSLSTENRTLLNTQGVTEYEQIEEDVQRRVNIVEE